MKKQINVHIGEYYASKEPVVIHTVLGSCVAVCLFDPANRIGGLNHILLPGVADTRCFNEPARYGINAMELLINRIMSLGGDRNRLFAKVFGGAHIVPTISRENGMGARNTSFVLEFLKKEKIGVFSKDVGGTDSRKIYFHTGTAEVFLKRIPAMYHKRIVKDEKSAFKQIQKAAHRAGKVTLFNE